MWNCQHYQPLCHWWLWYTCGRCQATVDCHECIIKVESKQSRSKYTAWKAVRDTAIKIGPAYLDERIEYGQEEELERNQPLPAWIEISRLPDQMLLWCPRWSGRRGALDFSCSCRTAKIRAVVDHQVRTHSVAQGTLVQLIVAGVSGGLLWEPFL